MAETFNCPKCGAPIKQEEENFRAKESVTCDYCGETVIVPPELRAHRPSRTAQPTVIIQTSTYTPPAPVRRANSAGCSIFVVLLIFGMIAIGIITSLSMEGAVMAMINKSLSGVIPELETQEPARPTPTDAISAVRTQIAPLLEQVTQVVSDLKTQIPQDTPAPAEDATATAVVLQATRTAQSAQAALQRDWPIVLEEKFADDHLGWTSGVNNNNLALEDMTIAENKYTWAFTSKKGMASFSYPTMPEQSDQLVSVDLQMLDSNGNLDDQAGITFRQSQADQTFYFFAVNPSGAYSLTMYDGSGWNTLIPTTPTDLLKAKQVNHIAVSIQSSQILLMINDSVADSYEDAQLSAGIAGLGLHLPFPGEDATVIFSNFTVRAPGN